MYQLSKHPPFFSSPTLPLPKVQTRFPAQHFHLPPQQAQHIYQSSPLKNSSAEIAEYQQLVTASLSNSLQISQFSQDPKSQSDVKRHDQQGLPPFQRSRAISQPDNINVVQGIRLLRNVTPPQVVRTILPQSQYRSVTSLSLSRKPPIIQANPQYRQPFPILIDQKHQTPPLSQSLRVFPPQINQKIERTIPLPHRRSHSQTVRDAVFGSSSQSASVYLISPAVPVVQNHNDNIHIKTFDATFSTQTHQSLASQGIAQPMKQEEQETLKNKYHKVEEVEFKEQYQQLKDQIVHQKSMDYVQQREDTISFSGAKQLGGSQTSSLNGQSSSQLFQRTSEAEIEEFEENFHQLFPADIVQNPMDDFEEDLIVIEENSSESTVVFPKTEGEERYSPQSISSQGFRKGQEKENFHIQQQQQQQQQHQPENSHHISQLLSYRQMYLSSASGNIGGAKTFNNISSNTGSVRTSADHSRSVHQAIFSDAKTEKTAQSSEGVDKGSYSSASKIYNACGRVKESLQYSPGDINDGWKIKIGESENCKPQLSQITRELNQQQRLISDLSTQKESLSTLCNNLTSELTKIHEAWAESNEEFTIKLEQERNARAIAEQDLEEKEKILFENDKLIDSLRKQAQERLREDEIALMNRHEEQLQLVIESEGPQLQEVNELLKQLQIKESQIEDLKKILREKEEKEALNQKLKHLEAQRSQFSSAQHVRGGSARSDDLRRIIERNSHLEGENAGMQLHIQQLETKIKSAVFHSDHTKRSQGQMDALLEQNLNLSSELSSLRYSSLNQESQCQQLKQSKSLLECQLEQVKIQEREAKQLNSILKENIERHQAMLEQTEKEYELLKGENSAYQQALAMTETKMKLLGKGNDRR